MKQKKRKIYQKRLKKSASGDKCLRLSFDPMKEWGFKEDAQYIDVNLGTKSVSVYHHFMYQGVLVEDTIALLQRANELISNGREVQS